MLASPYHGLSNPRLEYFGFCVCGPRFGFRWHVHEGAREVYRGRWAQRAAGRPMTHRSHARSGAGDIPALIAGYVRIGRCPQRRDRARV